MVGLPKGGVVAKGKRKFTDVHIMTFLSSCDQVLAVLELLPVCHTMDFFGRVVRLFIQGCQSITWDDFREGCGWVMHVMENVLVGHGGEEFDLGEVWIQNLDCSWR